MHLVDLRVRLTGQEAIVLISPSFISRTDVQLVQILAKASSGRLSSAANQTGTFLNISDSGA
jgi:hypothetical protein